MTSWPRMNLFSYLLIPSNPGYLKLLKPHLVWMIMLLLVILLLKVDSMFILESWIKP